MKETRTLEIGDGGSFVGIDIKNDDAERVVLLIGGTEEILSPDDARGLATWLLKNLASSTGPSGMDTALIGKEAVSSVGNKKEPQPKPGLEGRTARASDPDESRIMAGVKFEDFSDRLPKGGIPVKFTVKKQS